MNRILYFLLQYLHLYGKTLSINCPNYQDYDSDDFSSSVGNDKPSEPASSPSGPSKQTRTAKCDFSLTDPKKIINPYKKDIENYVESKPFGSLCLKCSMCLAVAKEMDEIFKEITNTLNKDSKQTDAVSALNEMLHSLCSFGFENHDLRRFKQYQVVTDQFQCSSHIRSKMDGKWTEKLREICFTYLYHMDVHYLLNEYIKGTHDLDSYLCRTAGIFRDCSSLNLKTTSIAPSDEKNFLKCD